MFASPVYAQIQEWGGCVVDNVPTVKCIEIVFGNLLFMSSTFLLIVLFLMLVMGSYYYLTSFGSADKVKKGQATIKFAVAGFILYLSAFVILKTIDVIFLGNKGCIFKFEIGVSPDPNDPCRR